MISALDGPDLLRQASALLAREAQRLSPALADGLPALSGAGPLGAPGGAPSLGDIRQPTAPLLGAAAPLPGTDDNRLKQQADDLLAGLLTGFGRSPGGVPDLAGLRQQAQELFETLLLTLNERGGAKSVPADNRVPLLQCQAPAQAGTQARAVLDDQQRRDDAVRRDSLLHQLRRRLGTRPLCAARDLLPGRSTIPPGGEATFQIRIAVPPQVAAGIYSGLIQAMGSRYVKAVLSLEVL